MKKIFPVLLCIIFACSLLAGCGANNSTGGCGQAKVDPISAQRPWTNNNGYEYVKYDVERRADGAQGELEASGTLTYKLYDVVGNFTTSDVCNAVKEKSDYFTNKVYSKLSKAQNSYSVLFMDYSLTYVSGDVDTLSSVLVYKTSSLLPVFSEKTADYQSSSTTYTATADYANGKNVFTVGNDVTETSLSDNLAYDNELLYYVIRTHTSLALGGSSAVSIRNSVYTGINNEESLRTMAFAVGSSESVVTGIDEDKTGFVARYFHNGDLKYYDSEEKNDKGEIEHYKGYVIPCYLTQLQYNSQKRGTTTLLSYSSASFAYAGTSTEKVLLQIITYENTYDDDLTSMTIANISDYKVSTLM